MNTAKDIKLSIINAVIHIDDYNQLKAIYENVERVGDKDNLSQAENLSLDEAIVDIREGVTIDDIVKEQNVKQISYKEIKEIAADMEWEQSLEELLAGID